MELRGIVVLWEILAQKAPLAQLENLVPLEWVSQGCRVHQGRSVSLVNLGQLDQRVSWDHLGLQGFLDLQENLDHPESSLVEKREVLTFNVLLTVQQDQRAHKDSKESRDTRAELVFLETQEASARRGSRERLAFQESRASQDPQVPWVSEVIPE